MIFKQWQQVLDGTKTQTRRLVKPGEECRDRITVSKYWISRFKFMPSEGADLLSWTYMNPKWQAGRIYAVQPGRGQKAVGRIRITEIRRERLQDISEEDAQREGWDMSNLDLLSRYDPVTMTKATEWFCALWDSIHKKPGTRWTDNPEVWVLTFEIVE